MTPLTDTPNEFRRILDNADAKLVLVQVGLIEKLLEYGKRPAGLSLSESWSARLYYTDHPTHWLVADYFCGFANPNDNGFAVDCIPKSKISLAQFRRTERAKAPDRFPNEIGRSEIGTSGATTN